MPAWGYSFAFFLLSLLILVVLITLFIGIVHPPMSVNVMANEVAVFNCTAIATFIDWRVNNHPAGEGFTNTSNQVLNSVQNIRSSTLYVQSLTEYNGYEINCFIYLDGCYEISMPAVFNVFGKIH